MKKRTLKVTKKNVTNRKTPYIYINGVKATTYDVRAFWRAYKAGTDVFSMKVDENGDIQLISKED